MSSYLITSTPGWGLRKPVPSAEKVFHSAGIIAATTFAAFSILALSAIFSQTASAAPLGRTIPSLEYKATFRSFHEGEYLGAFKDFRRAGRGAIKNAQTNWIDSICYHAMCGECCYEMGQYPEALEHYDSAVKLFLAFSNWMTLVKFQDIRPAGAQRPVPWAPGGRNLRLGFFPETMLIRQGEVLTEERLRQGGTIQQPVYMNIEVQEIVRATALAIRRRAELLGPLSPHDQLTGELLTALERRPGLPNHWSEAWIDVQLGLAQLAAGKDTQAVKTLQRSLAAGGEYAHPLTAVALLELGKLAMKTNNFDAAAKYFADASCAAYYYPDPTIIDESLGLGALVHLVANRKGPYTPLDGAVRFAKSEGYRRLQASLLLWAAELAAADGQTRQAAAFLDQAQTAMARRDMAAGRPGVQLAYLQSLVFFQNGQTAEGNQALARAMQGMGTASLWLFQIGMADRQFTGGGITPRLAMEFFDNLLCDPGPADWTLRPMEAMAVLTHPHPLPMEHWFEVAIGRKDAGRALEIADGCRRHRFFSTRPFGGRLESLRWLLEGPEETLDAEFRIHRQDILQRYPAYDSLSKRAAELRAELRSRPPVVEDAKSEEAAAQRKLLDELSNLCGDMEARLRRMSVGREPAALVFPPLYKTEKIQASLAEGHALLAFFCTSRETYAFLFNKEQYDFWRLGSQKVLANQLTKTLQGMGQYGPLRDYTMQDATDTAWKKSAQSLLETILKGSKADFSKRFEELIIVPDGIFWYVPFEALQVRAGDKTESLLSRFRIRYAPTAALAVPDGRAQKKGGATGVVVGKLHPRSEETAAKDAFDELAAALPGTYSLPKPPPVRSSLYRVLFDSLISLDEIQPSTTGPYGWSPLGIDRARGAVTLQEWMDLPWGGPQTVVLPGFHTAAENAAKGVSPAAAGDEVFLSACALMSSGVKTIVLSRWRMGGRSSFDVVREFMQELPHTSPAESWQRAALLAADSPLDPAAEPRIKQTLADAETKAEHPLFWSGYLLIDSGVSPPKAAAPAEPHKLEFKKQDKSEEKAEAKPDEKAAEIESKPEDKPAESKAKPPKPEKSK